MPVRKNVIADGVYCHIFNKSIAHFEIFRTPADFEQFTRLIAYYKFRRSMKYSYFEAHKAPEPPCLEKLVEIIAYCVMPTHFHLILKSLGKDSICVFMNRLSSAYSHHFNLKHNRKGPLWEGRFKNVAVETDEQLIHLTRYVHLNPVTAGLVQKPESWEYSSYREYLDKRRGKICEYGDILAISPEDYLQFVEEGIERQRELAEIKRLALKQSFSVTVPGTVTGVLKL